MDPMNPGGTAAPSVEVVWCACEYCAAMGPQYMVAIRHAHEVLMPLRAGCCGTAHRSVFSLLVSS
jgi:hypothetical protein